LEAWTDKDGKPIIEEKPMPDPIELSLKKR
jgi:hypothetical protein